MKDRDGLKSTNSLGHGQESTGAGRSRLPDESGKPHGRKIDGIMHWTTTVSRMKNFSASLGHGIFYQDYLSGQEKLFPRKKWYEIPESGERMGRE
jgi:hypothetical protein